MNVEGWQKLFPTEEIPRILRVVERCASQLIKASDNELENDLSDRLRALIVRDAEYRDDVAAQVLREFTIYDETGASIKQIGRGDFAFIHGMGRNPYPYFIIEAKRLHVTFPSGWNTLVPEYVTGQQGMMCFIEERYSLSSSAGAMLGYVFDGQISKAQKTIQALIKKEAEMLKCIAPVDFVHANMTGSSAKISRHTVRGKPFAIYHLFAAV